METQLNEVLTIDVGARLRQLRTERGKSMRALARLSNLSTNALSMIERGRTSPSVSTLFKLSEALEVPITAFFRQEPQRQEIVYRPAAERSRLPIQSGLWEGLGGDAFIGRVEPFIIALNAGCSSGPFGLLHSGSEFILCLSGEVEYEIDQEKFTLTAGDTLLFSAQHRHRWHNPSQTTAELLVVLAGFDQGERPSEFHLASGRRSIQPGDEIDNLSADAVDAEDL